MDELIRRWQRATERAAEEQVRVVRLGEGYFATSSSQVFGAYQLLPSAEGWTCECIANGHYHLPCKHLAALAEALDLDVFSDVRIDWSLPAEVPPAA